MDGQSTTIMCTLLMTNMFSHFLSPCFSLISRLLASLSSLVSLLLSHLSSPCFFSSLVSLLLSHLSSPCFSLISRLLASLSSLVSLLLSHLSSPCLSLVFLFTVDLLVSCVHLINCCRHYWIMTLTTAVKKRARGTCAVRQC